MKAMIDPVHGFLCGDDSLPFSSVYALCCCAIDPARVVRTQVLNLVRQDQPMTSYSDHSMSSLS